MATYFQILTLVLLSVIASAFGGEITVINNCNDNIYIKNSGSNRVPFFLQKGKSERFQLNQDASSRVWAHKGCDNNGNNCDTTEGYVSLAEMKWDDTKGMKGFTWYDISQVDGFSLPITMQPYNPNAGGNCNTVGCNFNLNDCPGASKVRKNGQVVACKNNDRDRITEYSTNMKQACPNVYSWSKDDLTGMRSCRPGNTGIMVTFC